MIDEMPIKNFDHLIGEQQKFAIVKLDIITKPNVKYRDFFICIVLYKYIDFEFF